MSYEADKAVESVDEIDSRDLIVEVVVGER